MNNLNLRRRRGEDQGQGQGQGQGQAENGTARNLKLNQRLANTRDRAGKWINIAKQNWLNRQQPQEEKRAAEENVELDWNEIIEKRSHWTKERYAQESMELDDKIMTTALELEQVRQMAELARKHATVELQQLEKNYQYSYKMINVIENSDSYTPPTNHQLGVMFLVELRKDVFNYYAEKVYNDEKAVLPPIQSRLRKVQRLNKQWENFHFIDRAIITTKRTMIRVQRRLIHELKQNQLTQIQTSPPQIQPPSPELKTLFESTEDATESDGEVSPEFEDTSPIGAPSNAKEDIPPDSDANVAPLEQESTMQPEADHNEKPEIDSPPENSGTCWDTQATEENGNKETRKSKLEHDLDAKPAQTVGTTIAAEPEKNESEVGSQPETAAEKGKSENCDTEVVAQKSAELDGAPLDETSEDEEETAEQIFQTTAVGSEQNKPVAFKSSATSLDALGALSMRFPTTKMKSYNRPPQSVAHDKKINPSMSPLDDAKSGRMKRNDDNNNEDIQPNEKSVSKDVASKQDVKEEQFNAPTSEIFEDEDALEEDAEDEFPVAEDIKEVQPNDRASKNTEDEDAPMDELVHYQNDSLRGNQENAMPDIGTDLDDIGNLALTDDRDEGEADNIAKTHTQNPSTIPCEVPIEDHLLSNSEGKPLAEISIDDSKIDAKNKLFQNDARSNASKECTMDPNPAVIETVGVLDANEVENCQMVVEKDMAIDIRQHRPTFTDGTSLALEAGDPLFETPSQHNQFFDWDQGADKNPGRKACSPEMDDHPSHFDVLDLKDINHSQKSGQAGSINAYHADDLSVEPIETAQIDAAETENVEAIDADFKLSDYDITIEAFADEDIEVEIEDNEEPEDDPAETGETPYSPLTKKYFARITRKILKRSKSVGSGLDTAEDFEGEKKGTRRRVRSKSVDAEKKRSKSKDSTRTSRDGETRERRRRVRSKSVDAERKRSKSVEPERAENIDDKKKERRRRVRSKSVDAEQKRSRSKEVYRSGRDSHDEKLAEGEKRWLRRRVRSKSVDAENRRLRSKSVDRTGRTDHADSAESEKKERRRRVRSKSVDAEKERSRGTKLDESDGIPSESKGQRRRVRSKSVDAEKQRSRSKEREVAEGKEKKTRRRRVRSKSMDAEKTRSEDKSKKSKIRRKKKKSAQGNEDRNDDDISESSNSDSDNEILRLYRIRMGAAALTTSLDVEHKKLYFEKPGSSIDAIDDTALHLGSEIVSQVKQLSQIEMTAKIAQQQAATKIFLDEKEDDYNGWSMGKMYSQADEKRRMAEIETQSVPAQPEPGSQNDFSTLESDLENEVRNQSSELRKIQIAAEGRHAQRTSFESDGSDDQEESGSLTYINHIQRKATRIQKYYAETKRLRDITPASYFSSEQQSDYDISSELESEVANQNAALKQIRRPKIPSREHVRNDPNMTEDDSSKKYEHREELRRMQRRALAATRAEQIEAQVNRLSEVNDGEDDVKNAISALKEELTRQQGILVHIQEKEKRARQRAMEKRIVEDNDENYGFGRIREQSIILKNASMLEIQSLRLEHSDELPDIADDSVSDLEQDVATQSAAFELFHESTKRAKEKAGERRLSQDSMEGSDTEVFDESENLLRSYAKEAALLKLQKHPTLGSSEIHNMNAWENESVTSVEEDEIEYQRMALMEIQQEAERAQAAARTKRIADSDDSDGRSDDDTVDSRAMALRRMQFGLVKGPSNSSGFLQVIDEDGIGRRTMTDSERGSVSSIEEFEIEGQNMKLLDIQASAWRAQERARTKVISDSEDSDGLSDDDLTHSYSRAAALRNIKDVDHLYVVAEPASLKNWERESLHSIDEDEVGRQHVELEEIQNNARLAQERAKNMVFSDSERTQHDDSLRNARMQAILIARAHGEETVALARAFEEHDESCLEDSFSSLEAHVAQQQLAHAELQEVIKRGKRL